MSEKSTTFAQKIIGNIVDITVFHTGLPERLLSQLEATKSFHVSLDDNESTPHILILYNMDVDTMRERLSILDKTIPTNVICVYTEKQSLRDISDIMVSNVSLIVADDIPCSVLMNSIKSIIASNIYNAAQRSKRWEGIRYELADNVVYIPSKGELDVLGVKNKLNKKEQAIMNILCDNAGEYVEKKELLMTIWGRTDTGASRSFDVYINRLRHLLDTGGPTILTKIRGTGYRLEERQNEKG